MIRACLIACTLIAVATASWGAPGGAVRGKAVPGIGKGHIRIEATIPGYLKLSTSDQGVLAPTDGSAGIVRTVALKAEANTPWALMATLRNAPSGAECIVRQLGQSGWQHLESGRATRIPCSVRHFAGEHRIVMEWQVTASGSDDVAVEFELIPDGMAVGALFEAPRQVEVAWAPDGTAIASRMGMPIVTEYTPAVIIR